MDDVSETLLEVKRRAATLVAVARPATAKTIVPSYPSIQNQTLGWRNIVASRLIVCTGLYSRDIADDAGTC